MVASNLRPGVSHELCQTLSIGIRALVEDLLQSRFIAFPQSIPPGLHFFEDPGLLQRSALDPFESGTDRIRIAVAHQHADVLQLTAPGAMGFHAAARANRLVECFGYFDGGQLFRRQCQELLPQALQGAIFILLPGAALGRFNIHGMSCFPWSLFPRRQGELGYIFAAIIAALVLPVLGWRVLFLVGIIPAFLTLWIRRNIPEPEIWKNKTNKTVKPTSSILTIFKPPLVKKTLIATLITTSVLFAYWGLFTWMPSFLSKDISQGGAGLGIVKSSTWIIPMQIGAFFGYLSFGFFADRFGRRPVFFVFLVFAAILVIVYGQLARHEIILLLLGPFIGFFGHGYFSVFGAMLSELFPTHIRGTAQGLTYNLGRAFSALAPFTVGALADIYGIGSALAVTAFFFLLGAGFIYLLPETKGQSLE